MARGQVLYGLPQTSRNLSIQLGNVVGRPLTVELRLPSVTDAVEEALNYLGSQLGGGGLFEIELELELQNYEV